MNLNMISYPTYHHNYISSITPNNTKNVMLTQDQIDLLTCNEFTVQPIIIYLNERFCIRPKIPLNEIVKRINDYINYIPDLSFHDFDPNICYWHLRCENNRGFSEAYIYIFYDYNESSDNKYIVSVENSTNKYCQLNISNFVLLDLTNIFNNEEVNYEHLDVISYMNRIKYENGLTRQVTIS